MAEPADNVRPDKAPADPDVDAATGVETTGHEWDGVRELNMPLPRWWLTLFYATIVFSIGYMILYPAVPLIEEATDGLLGYSTRAEAYEAVAEADAALGGLRARVAEAPFDEIRADPELYAFAADAGAAAFAVNCSQCHGSGAAGAAGGYPNLNDDAWIWGGEIEEIRFTIAHGVRNQQSPEAHFSEMPAFGDLLARDEIAAVAHHVLALSGQEHDAAAAERGAQIYLDNCAACHRENGDGDDALGAPRLSDAIWLYDGDFEAVASQIRRPKHGAMPAWGLKLDDATVKALALWVHDLGGGE